VLRTPVLGTLEAASLLPTLDNIQVFGIIHIRKGKYAMIKTVRLNIPYNEDKSQKEATRELLESIGLTLEDVSIKSPYDWKNPSSSTHFGNWCLVPVRALPQLETLKTDLPAYILELSDIESLKPGERVRLQYTNGLAGQNEGAGIVVRVSLDSSGYNVPFVEIQKSGTSKGWRLCVSDNAAIWKAKGVTL